MSNLKISQLPEYSGSTAGSWLIANNAVETGTYKIQRENFLSGYALTSSLSALSSSIAVTDLSQNNTIATLATTSSLTALSSSIATTDLSQNNRLTTIEGRYATTGSNVFRGNQTITGSLNVTGSSTLNAAGGNNILTGSINAIESVGVGNYVVARGGGSNFIEASINQLSGSVKNRIIGPTEITGSLIASSSISNTLQSMVGNTLLSNGTNSLQAPENYITSSILTRIVSPVITMTGSLNVSSSISGSVHNISGPTNIFNGGLNVSASAASVNNIISSNLTSGTNTIQGWTNIIRGINKLEGDTTITGSLTASGSLHRLIGNTTITGSLNVTSGATISGSIITTGSVQGNVNALTITSNTASLNLNNGNFFTLQLVGGQATHLTPSNIKPGQTISVFVNTTGSAIMTFPSSIKQMSGSAYTPTIITGLDVLTFISKDSSNLYMVSAKNFI